MFVLTPRDGRTVAVPLVQVAGLTADEKTEQAVENWRYWAERGYEL